MASSNQQDLLKFLGPEYSLKEIDNELCVYRKINARYDVELSGTARKNRPISVFVWDVSGGEGPAAVIAEEHFDISGWDDLKTLLENLTRKYQGLA